MHALAGARIERSGFDSTMKLFAFVAALGLIISLASTTPAFHDEKKDAKSSEQLERAMPVDPAATITVCVRNGTISVRGWDKHEVHVSSGDAGVIDFRRIDKVKPKDKEKAIETPATRVDVMVMDKSDKTGKKGDCQAIADVEVEVPHGATVQVQTRDGDIHIVGVAAVYAGSQNGDIDIESASKLVEAGSVGGSILVRDSAGRMNLSSAGGTVNVANVKGTSADDTFEVATVSGDVQLEHVSNSKLVVKTVNGSVLMSGALVRSGQYGFTTLSGDVTLALPTDASFQIVAKLSETQNIISDFKLKYSEVPGAPAPTPKMTPAPDAVPQPPTPKAQSAPTVAPKTASPPPARTPQTPKPGSQTTVIIKPSIAIAPYALRRIVATCGSGDANIAVNSFSGTVRLKKL
jgi:putative adhesin